MDALYLSLCSSRSISRTEPKPLLAIRSMDLRLHSTAYVRKLSAPAMTTHPTITFAFTPILCCILESPGRSFRTRIWALPCPAVPLPPAHRDPFCHFHGQSQQAGRVWCAILCRTRLLARVSASVPLHEGKPFLVWALRTEVWFCSCLNSDKGSWGEARVCVQQADSEGARGFRTHGCGGGAPLPTRPLGRSPSSSSSVSA